MREILFRGKRIDNCEWVYGNLIQRNIWGAVFPIIRAEDNGYGNFKEWEVIPETVGQYTGLDDKNGMNIFTGDAVKATQKGQTKNGVVVYREGGYFWEFETDQYGYLGEVVKRWHPEVIGNVTDNPELMEWE